MQVEERVANIVDLPLKSLELLFSGLGAAMTKAADEAERIAEDLDGDEKFTKIFMAVHSRGIAAGMEVAVSELVKVRALVQEAADEARANS